MRPLLIPAVLVCVTFLGACGGSGDETEVAAETGRQLTGILRNNPSSPEGSITGWVVEEEGTGKVIPVDLAKVIEQAQRWTGNRVVITGTMSQRPQTDGASKDVFVAEAILFAQP